MTLYLFSSFLALGIIAASVFSFPLSFALLPLLLGAALFAYLKIMRVHVAAIAFAAVALVGFSLGLGRMILTQVPKPDPLAIAADSQVELTGVVSEDSDERESYTQLVITTNSASVSGQAIALAGADEKILARVPIASSFRYGDLVTVSGKLEKPENFETDSGRTFDYVNYLAKDGIGYEIGFAQAALVSHGHGAPLTAALISVKRSFEAAISNSIPAPEGSLENGILLGAKQSLPQATLDDFKLAGLSHVVVLSGYNISIVAQNVLRAAAFLPELAALGTGALSVILFSIMAGGGASVIRAAVMAIISLVARATHREYDAFRALIIAALLMVIQNPMIVTSDPSFELSFLATIGIIAVTPIAEERFKFVPEKHKFRETIVTTVSTQMFVLPFLLYMSGIVSPAAFPANLLVLPLVPITMFAGFITALAAFISPWLALVPGFAAYGLLSYMLGVTHFFAHIPFGSFTVDNFPIWAVALWYASYGVIIWRWHRKRKPGEKAAEVPAFDTSLAFEIVE